MMILAVAFIITAIMGGAVLFGPALFARLRRANTPSLPSSEADELLAPAPHALGAYRTPSEPEEPPAQDVFLADLERLVRLSAALAKPGTDGTVLLAVHADVLGAIGFRVTLLHVDVRTVTEPSLAHGVALQLEVLDQLARKSLDQAEKEAAAKKAEVDMELAKKRAGLRGLR
jgi:hypothetical protein